MKTSLRTTSQRKDVDELRARAEELADNAREQAEVARLRAEELASVARERASEAGDQARERASEVADSVGPWITRLMALLSSVFAGLGERGREVAARVEPPARVRRRRRLATAGWVTGGFLAGAATGWVLHARLREQPQEPGPLYGDTDAFHADDRAVSPYGSDAEAIDARQENRPVR